MSIVTTENLADFLSDELSWRKKELSGLLGLLTLKQGAYEKEGYLARSSLAILYAHWEGFIKSASKGYLEFVAMQRLKNEDVAPNFLAIICKNKFGTLHGGSQVSAFEDILDFFSNRMGHRSNLPYKTVIETSNMKFEKFEEIIWILGLDISLFESKKVFIDKKLVDRRHNIAHGKYLPISFEDYLELHHEVIQLLDLFKRQIETAASNRKFLKSSIGKAQATV